MKNLLTSLRTLILALVLSIGVSYAYATWTAPTATPPLGNIATPVNIGDNAQIKEGNLMLNNTGGFVNGLIVRYGNVGIGMTNPTVKLDVGGAIRVGDTSTCTAGAIRFRSNDFEGCTDGTTWKSLTATGGSTSPPPPAPYATAGTYSLTVPSGVSSMTITAGGAGGGGGGGGGSNGSQNGNGGNGGGAGQISTITSTVTAGDVFTINVGAGGNGGGGGYEHSGFGPPDGSTGQGGFASSVVKDSTSATIISVIGGGGGPGGANSGGNEVGSKGADCSPYGVGGNGGGGIWDPGKIGGTCSGGGGGGGGATSVNKQGASGGKGGDGIITITW